MTKTTVATTDKKLGRVIIMRLRVEPDEADTRTDTEIADDISDFLIDPSWHARDFSALPGSGIAIATLMGDDPANRPRRVG